MKKGGGGGCLHFFSLFFFFFFAQLGGKEMELGATVGRGVGSEGKTVNSWGLGGSLGREGNAKNQKKKQQQKT